MNKDEHLAIQTACGALLSAKALFSAKHTDKERTVKEIDLALQRLFRARLIVTHPEVMC